MTPAAAESEGRTADMIGKSFGSYQNSRSIFQCRSNPVWQRLGMAGSGRQQACSNEDKQCRHADNHVRQSSYND